MVLRLTPFELGYILLLFVSTIWIYFDAPKQGIKRYVAVLGLIFLLFPISLIIYILRTRVFNRKLFNK